MQGKILVEGIEMMSEGSVKIGPRAVEYSAKYFAVIQTSGLLTLTEWSIDDVSSLHFGKEPIPQMMSVIGKV